jgi:hypothetical protein
VVLLKNKPQTLVILTDDYGSRIISPQDNKAIQREKDLLVNEFIDLHYSYNQLTIRDRVSKSGDYMSDQLWKNESEKALKFIEENKGKEFSQSFDVVSMKAISDTQYDITLRVVSNERLNEVVANLKVFISLAEKPRSLNNPYPFEVSEIKEEIQK